MKNPTVLLQTVLPAQIHPVFRAKFVQVASPTILQRARAILIAPLALFFLDLIAFVL